MEMEWLWPDSFTSMALMHDKWAHAGGCALWVAFLWAAFQATRYICGCRYYFSMGTVESRRARRRDLWAIWALVMLVGVAFEFWQGIFSPFDVVANGIGATVALLAIKAGRR